jgi:hypothetical protein
MSEPLPLAIPECRLDAAALGPQIRRYRQLASHVTRLERTVGEVRVEFDASVPDGLLGRTLAVERGCCTFVGIEYEPQSRTLTFTVANVAQDPRLDSFAALLAPPEQTGPCKTQQDPARADDLAT